MYLKNGKSEQSKQVKISTHYCVYYICKLVDMNDEI